MNNMWSYDEYAPNIPNPWWEYAEYPEDPPAITQVWYRSGDGRAPDVPYYEPFRFGGNQPPINVGDGKYGPAPPIDPWKIMYSADSAMGLYVKKALPLVLIGSVFFGLGWWFLSRKKKKRKKYEAPDDKNALKKLILEHGKDNDLGDPTLTLSELKGLASMTDPAFDKVVDALFDSGAVYQLDKNSISMFSNERENVYSAYDYDVAKVQKKLNKLISEAGIRGKEWGVSLDRGVYVEGINNRGNAEELSRLINTKLKANTSVEDRGEYGFAIAEPWGGEEYSSGYRQPRPDVLKDAMSISSGTLATLTNKTDYRTLDNIQDQFVDWLKTDPEEYSTWQEAWEDFWPDSYRPMFRPGAEQYSSRRLSEQATEYVDPRGVPSFADYLRKKGHEEMIAKPRGFKPKPPIPEDMIESVEVKIVEGGNPLPPKQSFKTLDEAEAWLFTQAKPDNPGTYHKSDVWVHLEDGSTHRFGYDLSKQEEPIRDYVKTDRSLKYGADDTEFITYKQWDSYSKRLEKKALREHGKSWSFSTIEHAANPYIVEIRSDEKTMIVKKGWREAMKKKANENPDTSKTDNYSAGNNNKYTVIEERKSDGFIIVMSKPTTKSQAEQAKKTYNHSTMPGETTFRVVPVSYVIEKPDGNVLGKEYLTGEEYSSARPKKVWSVTFLRDGKKFVDTITLGPASDRGDVKQAIRRQGLTGEILNIGEVGGDEDFYSADNSNPLEALIFEDEVRKYLKDTHKHVSDKYPPGPMQYKDAIYYNIMNKHGDVMELKHSGNFLINHKYFVGIDGYKYLGASKVNPKTLRWTGHSVSRGRLKPSKKDIEFITQLNEEMRNTEAKIQDAFKNPYVNPTDIKDLHYSASFPPILKGNDSDIWVFREMSNDDLWQYFMDDEPKRSKMDRADIISRVRERTLGMDNTRIHLIAEWLDRISEDAWTNDSYSAEDEDFYAAPASARKKSYPVTVDENVQREMEIPIDKILQDTIYKYTKNNGPWHHRLDKYNQFQTSVRVTYDARAKKVKVLQKGTDSFSKWCKQFGGTPRSEHGETMCRGDNRVYDYKKIKNGYESIIVDKPPEKDNDYYCAEDPNTLVGMMQRMAKDPNVGLDDYLQASQKYAEEKSFQLDEQDKMMRAHYWSGLAHGYGNVLDYLGQRDATWNQADPTEVTTLHAEDNKNRYTLTYLDDAEYVIMQPMTKEEAANLKQKIEANKDMSGRYKKLRLRKWDETWPALTQSGYYPIPQDRNIMSSNYYAADKPDADDGIRDMFWSRQYKGVVPDGDIQHILKSKRWARFYGKGKAKQAWTELVEDGYVEKVGNDWHWLGYQDT